MREVIDFRLGIVSEHVPRYPVLMPRMPDANPHATEIFADVRDG